MANITYTQVNELIDNMCAQYNSLYGTVGTGYGIGDGTWGVSKGLTAYGNIVDGSTDATFCDLTLQSIFNAPTVTAIAAITMAKMAQGVFAPLLNTLSGACQAMGTANSIASIVDLNSFMAYYNWGTGGNALCLAPAVFYNLYYAWKGSYPTATNLYQEILQGATYTNALAKDAVAVGADTNTLGYTIDPTKYGGGQAYVQWPGTPTYVGGAVSITVTGLNQAGVSKTFSLSGTGAAGNFPAGAQTGVALVPQTAGDYITKVTAVATSGITTLAALYIEARRPSGRTVPTVP